MHFGAPYLPAHSPTHVSVRVRFFFPISNFDATCTCTCTCTWHALALALNLHLHLHLTLDCKLPAKNRFEQNFAYKNSFFFPPHLFLNRKKKKQANEANQLPCSRAFPRRLCVRAPLTNVALEMWIQCYGKLSC